MKQGILGKLLSFLTLERMSLRFRLFLAILAAGLTSALIGATLSANYFLKQANIELYILYKNTSVLENSSRSRVAIENIKINLDDLDSLLQTNSRNFSEKIENIAMYVDSLSDSFQNLKLAKVEEAPVFSSIENASTAFQGFQDKTKQLTQIAKDPKVEITRISELRKAADTALNNVITANDKVMNAVQESSNRHKEMQQAQLYGGTLKAISFTFGSGVAVLFILIVTSLVRQLSNFTVRLGAVSQELSKAAHEMKETSHTLASSANEQAAVVQETASTLEEITAMIRSTLQNAQGALSSAKNVESDSMTGSNSIQEMDQAMEEIEQSNIELNSIKDIFKKISRKAEVINEIVFKTQILSFNASIEAVRAGEHGQGFTVVAEEVGSLAEKSGKAAEEIRDLLEESNTKVVDIVSSIKTRVEKGRGTSEQCVQAFTKVCTGIEDLASRVESICTAAEEQLTGVVQTKEAVGQISETSSSNSNMAGLTARIAGRVTKQAKLLQGTVLDLNALAFGRQKAPRKTTEVSQLTENNLRPENAQTEKQNFEEDESEAKIQSKSSLPKGVNRAQPQEAQTRDENDSHNDAEAA